MKLSNIYKNIISISTPPLQDKIWSNWVGKPITPKLECEIRQETQRLHYEQLAVQDSIWSAWSKAKVAIDRATGGISVTPPAPIIARPSPTQSSYVRIEEERRLNEQKAKDKAEILLLQHLSEKQKDDLLKKGFFLVEVGGETYKIKRGFAGNVKLLDKDTGAEAKSFCIHPRERVPDSDAMLAQKLLLETDTEKFLKIANITNLLPPRPPPQNDNQRAA